MAQVVSQTAPQVIPPEEERFAANINGFTNYLSQIVGELQKRNLTNIQPVLIIAAGAYLQVQGKHELIRGFIERSHNWWDSVRVRDETTFFQNTHRIFGELPQDQVNNFTVLFESKDDKGEPIVNQTARNEIWRIFGSLIKISIKYAYINQTYWKCSGLDVPDQARLWGINLTELKINQGM